MKKAPLQESDPCAAPQPTTGRFGCHGYFWLVELPFSLSQQEPDLQVQLPWGRKNSAINISVLPPRIRCVAPVSTPNKWRVGPVVANFKITANTTTRTPSIPTILAAQAQEHLQSLMGTFLSVYRFDLGYYFAANAAICALTCLASAVLP